jgi:transcriptional regulator with XRE-family HTH domain
MISRLKMNVSNNLVGRQVGKFRDALDWTQGDLADALQAKGWIISRSGVSKIESRLVHVYDFQMIWLASVLGVPRDALYPKFADGKPVEEMIFTHIHNEKRGLVLKPDSFDPALLAKKYF